jgi:2-oxoglutarate ferredoxin oxidoreductase subunit alpha
VVRKLKWDDSYRPDRGRVLDAAELEQIASFSRYAGENSDYVAPRTLPGVDAKGAYVTRGSGHNKFGAYTEIPDEYQEVVDRLALKHKAAAQYVPQPEIQQSNGSRIGIVSVGGCDPAVREAIDLLARDGVHVNYMRIRAFPFDDTVEAFLNEHHLCFVVEQNRDAQLRSLLTIETQVPKDRLRSVLVYGGFPLSARHVVDEIRRQLPD